ncbi:MAG: SAM-dependent methyltransferase [Anaerolineae bacterium]|nr:50S rRNA methyltransferase [Anaerolineae bacterium]MDW8300653.1 SAM-dependent methyltransferase [Anaerolineae bacterium]
MAVSAAQTVLTCNPAFEDLALREVRQAVSSDVPVRALAEGVLLLDVPFAALAATWRAKPPIFVRHICPAAVQLTLPRLAEPEALLVLLQNACVQSVVPHVAPALPFSVQTRVLSAAVPLKPFDVNNALAALVTDAPLDIRQPQQVISAAIGQVGEAATAWLGLSSVTDNLSDWAGGARRFAHEQGQISRSEFKLLEAIEVFRVQVPARGYALDLGAAPGGWTRVLREHGMYVTAVDPAALHARLLRDSGVRYRRTTAQAFLRTATDSYDLIVNDMRLDARDSARLMVAYAKLLRADGTALMSLKLPESGRLDVLERAFQILEGAYELIGARQLFHNRSEITVCLRRR